jgi:hypothetical protein
MWKEKQADFGEGKLTTKRMLRQKRAQRATFAKEPGREHDCCDAANLRLGEARLMASRSA